MYLLCVCMHTWAAGSQNNLQHLVLSSDHVSAWELRLGSPCLYPLGQLGSSKSKLYFCSSLKPPFHKQETR